MDKLDTERLLIILKQILSVDDLEIKNCALESLIENLEESIFNNAEDEEE